MKTRIIGCLFVCMAIYQLNAQFKYDNIAFKTVFINDLCDSLRKHPDRLILDVRTPGEFSDTSVSASLNIGHLKGAVNIDVSQLKDRLKEIEAYRNKPVFVICSHSQRSRICSKMLSDSGFTNVINVNGAMTEFNLLKNTSVPCVSEYYETANKFKLASPVEVAAMLHSKNVFVLDVRNDSAFRGITSDVMVNAQGKLKGAVNIPLTELATSLSRVPKNRPVLVTADFGRETNLAARLLTDHGYTDITAAFNGMSEWMNASDEELPQRKQFWLQPNRFTYITPVEMDALLTANPSAFILDARTGEEFNNQIKDRSWMNRGHVKNAVNIPNASLDSRLGELDAYKNKDIIVYTFGNNPEAFETAKKLTDNGFTKVHLLTGGIWAIRGKGANQKGLSRLMRWVVDVPEENL